MIGTTGREVRNPLLSRRAPLLALLVVVALVATGCGGLEARVRTEGRAELSAWAGDDNSSTDPATVTAEPTLSPVPTAEPSPTRTPTPNPTSTPPPAAKSASPASAELRTDPVEGALAPELSLPDLNGNEVRLSALRGKPVLLNFWTTWWPHCRRERSALQASHEKYPDLIIVSVDIAEDRDKVAVYAKEQGLTFAILLDSDSNAAGAYHVRGIPTSFFIDREGVIRATHTGALDEALIDGYVEQLLQ